MSSKKGTRVSATKAPATVADSAAGIDSSAPASAGVQDSQVLYGSSVLPAMIDIGGKQVQLGTVVAAAHVASQLTVAEWNAMDVAVRESLLADQVELMREQAAQAAAAEAVKPADPVVPAEPAAFIFPLQVILRNNGGFAVSEPVSGAYLQAGGSQIVTLHDEAHASRVVDNLRELALLNHLGDALVIEPMPAAQE